VSVPFNPMRRALPMALECRLFACAVERRRFPVGARPTRQPLEPDATGAIMEVNEVAEAFEDAHWSAPSSHELFDLVIERVPSLPVILIITSRPEFTPPCARK
jgi:hypothetical protein